MERRSKKALEFDLKLKTRWLETAKATHDIKRIMQLTKEIGHINNELRRLNLEIFTPENNHKTVEKVSAENDN